MKITTLIAAVIMTTSVTAFAQTTAEHPVHEARKEIRADKQKLVADVKVLKADKAAGNTEAVVADKAVVKADKQELKADVKSRIEAKKERRAEHKQKTN